MQNFPTRISCDSFWACRGPCRRLKGSEPFPYRFDLLARLTNDQGIMKNNSADEQALIKIQHEWAEARMKGDSSYTRFRRIQNR